MNQLPMTIAAAVAAITTIACVAHSQGIPMRRVPLAHPVPDHVWEDIASEIPLSDQQLMLWRQIYTELNARVTTTRDAHEAEIRRLSREVVEIDPDWRISLESLPLTDAIRKERVEFADWLVSEFTLAIAQMRPFVAASQRQDLDRALLSLERRSLFPSVSSLHRWLSPPPDQWFDAWVSQCECVAAETLIEVDDLRRSEDHYVLLERLTVALREFDRSHARLDQVFDEWRAGLDDVGPSLSNDELREYRLKHDGNLHREIRAHQQLEIRLVSLANHLVNSLAGALTTDNREQLLLDWNDRILPEWVKMPTIDAESDYSDVVELLRIHCDEDTIAAITAAASNAATVRAGSRREMTERFLVDFRRFMETRFSATKDTESARAFHTERRRRIARSQLASIAVIEQQALALATDPDGPLSDMERVQIRSTIDRLNAANSGATWQLRKELELAEASIASGEFTWPRFPDASQGPR